MTKRADTPMPPRREFEVRMLLIALEKARALIARGWCQNTQIDADGNVCVVGAIKLAAGVEHISVYRHLGFTMDTSRPNETWPAVWNDAPGRTQAEVLARFDAAIARLAAE